VSTCVTEPPHPQADALKPLAASARLVDVTDEMPRTLMQWVVDTLMQDEDEMPTCHACGRQAHYVRLPGGELHLRIDHQRCSAHKSTAEVVIITPGPTTGTLA
jgi:hypothetical protein